VTPEQNFFSNYVTQLPASGMPQSVKDNIIHDPSADDISYYQSNTYNNADAKPLTVIKNTMVWRKFSCSSGSRWLQSHRDNIPDAEDINKDNNMRTGEDISIQSSPEA